MKKPAVIFFAALMSLGAAARAAEVDFDGMDGLGAESIEEMIADLEDKGHHPPPPQHHPVNPPGHNNHHNPPHHPPKPPAPPPYHNPPHHPPVPPPYHPPSPPPPQYHFGGYERACQTLTFTSQSPLSVTREMTMREYGEECQSFSYGGHGYCRPASRYHSRKVTVNIGPRQLESWETERLEVCMEAPKRVTVDTSNMLYHYGVDTKNDEGFLGFNRRTTITMTPHAKKPSQPQSGELSVAFAGTTSHGTVLMINDSRADYFRGETITITAEGMRLPENPQNMPVQDLLDSFSRFNVAGTFDVSRAYELRLMSAPRPGKYMVTLKFYRSGPLSSGAMASTMEMIEIR
ncbi:MAG TPA: hypothetical protein PK523_09420 [Elusimicrobiales bacterium]|nr:hypothetical protein [Elusimicrobiales bacterium]